MPAAHLLILSSVPNANFVFFVSLMSLIIVLLSMLFIWQYRRGKRLSGYLTSVGSVQRHTVEHEMVLKSMRLSAWRIDARTREIIYESDYRDSVDSYTPRPGEKIDDFVKHLHPKDSERYFKAMDDICAGRIDEYTQQYQVRVGNTDKYYWAESYATIAERDDSGHPLRACSIFFRLSIRIDALDNSNRSSCPLNAPLELIKDKTLFNSLLISVAFCTFALRLAKGASCVVGCPSSEV